MCAVRGLRNLGRLPQFFSLKNSSRKSRPPDAITLIARPRESSIIQRRLKAPCDNDRRRKVV